ncbi:amino acid permease-like protein [Angomonas deanei]|nr:amino acid permease-like protein [Angomonas deanei]|eukprot:EPY40452.1 amino acid permease-like protein [Angomonas deanei]
MLKKYYMAKGGTLVSSAFNLASATLGAGALALPSAMLHSGFIVGILTLAVVYLFTVYSIYLLIKVGVLHELYSYEAIADDLLGSYSQEITGLFIVLFCWGVAVVYIVVMGDFMTPLMSTLGISHIIGRKTVMTIFFFCIMFPLSLARQVNTLRYASIVGCASTLLLAMATVIRTIEKGDTLSHMPMARFDTDSVSAISTYVFSYCCQPVAFSIFLEMKNASTKRMTFCASCSMLTCTLLYIVVGVFGALAFGEDTRPNVLTNLANHLDTPYVQLAYLGMMVTVTMSFPMTIFPTRESVVLALGYKEEGKDTPPLVSSGIAGILAILALLTGLFVPNIRVLFDVLGGICGGTISFLLPGLFAVRSEYWTIQNVGLIHVIGAWVTIFLGIGMCLLGTYNSVLTNFL